MMYADPVRIIKNCRGASASKSFGHLTRVVGSLALVMSVALMVPSGSAQAAPPSVRQPALPALDDQGILDAVADRSSELISVVRDGTTGLIDSAMNFLGVRYRLGGNSAETGFDCSGFTRYIFENSIGRVLPRRADEQANAPELAKVDPKDLKPGDLVFFDTMRRTFSHVGIYLGDGKFIHAPHTGASVRIEDINISYWARHFTGARRAPELAGAAGTSTGLGSSMLASLKARLLMTDPSSRTDATAATAAPVAPGVSVALSASLNPSGLRIGSTLPSLPNGSVAGFAPVHEPLARPVIN